MYVCIMCLCVYLLLEENLVSPFLAFCTFLQNLKMPVDLNNVPKFHDNRTTRNAPEVLSNMWLFYCSVADLLIHVLLSINNIIWR